MVRRPTLILLIIFAVLVGFALLFQRYQANKTSNVATTTPTTVLVKLYNLSYSQVNEIKIQDVGGDKIDLFRDPSSSNWAIANVPVDQANTSQIDSTTKQFLAIQIQDTLTGTVPLNSVGLDSPAYTVTFKTVDNAQLVTHVGSHTAVGSGYYVRVDSGQVVIVDSVVLDAILDMIKNPPLFPTATPEVTATESGTPIVTETHGTPTP